MKNYEISIVAVLFLSSCSAPFIGEKGLHEEMKVRAETRELCIQLKEKINKNLRDLGFVDFDSKQYQNILTQANSWSDLYYKTCNGVTFNN